MRNMITVEYDDSNGDPQTIEGKQIEWITHNRFKEPCIAVMGLTRTFIPVANVTNIRVN